MKAWRGTGFAAHNAISGWFNHERSIRKKTNRLECNLFGSGASGMRKGFAELDAAIAAAAS